MTEKECIEKLKVFPERNRDDLWLNADDMEDLVNFCVNALEEIQQYRAIGTVEECRKARERLTLKTPSIFGDGYDDEGNMIYDMYECPNCGKNYEIDYEKYDHCPACGQAIDWRGYDGEN